MTPPKDLRELAERVELEFHVRPHRFRRLAWWSGVVLSLLCCGWILYAAVTGDHRAYEAGPLSKAHAFIANDCRQCHLAWQPARRLLSGDESISSVSNAACVKCHAAAEHHPNQIPAHAELSCAACHREHRGQHELAQVTDRHCIRCHQNLQTNDGPSTRLARAVRGFSEAEGHPEFNVIQRLVNPQTPSNLISRVELDRLLQQNKSEGQQQQRFLDVLSERLAQPPQPATSSLRDRGEIKFNHAVHLDPVRIKDKTGQHVDLSQNCQACHVADAAGQYMQPIQYAQHCAQCHPLWFDNKNYPGVEVPHQTPDIVRGFLTEKYTLTVLKRAVPLGDSPIVRPLPGQADPPLLSTDQARRLDELVAQAERAARDHDRIAKSGGGCKLCHSIEESADDKKWSIQPTQIPERWMPHSQFNHAAHRMLNCVACHADVSTKRDTGDVMLPGIQDCQQCHVSLTRRQTLQVDGPKNNPTSVVAHDVTSRCVMCHTYHRREINTPSGRLDKQLRAPASSKQQ